jgi:hypothetical protein
MTRDALVASPDDTIQKAAKRAHDRQKNILINAAVGFSESNSLDALLRDHSVPADVDLLSINIDGNDYHAWDAIRKLRPKLVVIENRLGALRCHRYVAA